MSAYPQFPNLSRKPALKTKGTSVDPTLRSDLENGMESTRPRFTRERDQYTVTLEYLTADDVARLRMFLTNDAVFGSKAFYFVDDRDKTNPVQILARFSKLPEYTDAGWIEGELRQTATFELRTL